MRFLPINCCFLMRFKKQNRGGHVGGTNNRNWFWRIFFSEANWPIVAILYSPLKFLVYKIFIDGRTIKIVISSFSIKRLIKKADGANHKSCNNKLEEKKITFYSHSWTWMPYGKYILSYRVMNLKKNSVYVSPQSYGKDFAILGVT